MMELGHGAFWANQSVNGSVSTRWSDKVSECVVSLSSIESASDAQLGSILVGGAEFGQFCMVGDPSAKSLSGEVTLVVHAGAFRRGDILLEIQGCRISGMTQRDAISWWRSHGRHGHPVMFKSVPSSLLHGSLGEFLRSKYAKDTPDAALQQIIRQNVYSRTAACTTRSPRENEQNGVDYWFVPAAYFNELRDSGALLEFGQYEGNWYGTPVPPMEENAMSNRPVDASGLTLPLTKHQLKLLRSIAKRSSNSTQTSTPNKEAHLPVSIVFGGDRRDYVNSASVSTGSDRSDDLPYGWQRIDDPQYGTYYVDHLNRRTQYERPKQQLALVVQDRVDRRDCVTVPIVKGVNGFGFKLASSKTDGRQRVREITDPHRCGHLRVGDVLVAVDRHDVRAFTHTELVSLLQSYFTNSCIEFVVERDAGHSNGKLNVKPILPFESTNSSKRMMQSKSIPDLSGIPDTVRLPQQPVISSADYFGGSLSSGLDLDTPNSSSLVNSAPHRAVVNGGNARPSDLVIDHAFESASSPPPSGSSATSPDLLHTTPNFIPASLLLKRAAPNSSSNATSTFASHANLARIGGSNVSKSFMNLESLSTAQSLSLSPGSRQSMATSHLQTQNQLNANATKFGGPSPASPSGIDSEIFNVTLNWSERGFGFKVIGGAELLSPVSVGFLEPHLSADGRLRLGDELLSVNSSTVDTCAAMTQLINRIAAQKQPLHLTIRRVHHGKSNVPQMQQKLIAKSPSVSSTASEAAHVQVTLQRRTPNESFGFVMVTNLTERVMTIARVQPDSPASRCNLHINDRLLTVNGVDLSGMTHDAVVTMIKQAGATLRLTIIPASARTEMLKSTVSGGISRANRYAMSGPNSHGQDTNSSSNGYGSADGSVQQSTIQLQHLQLADANSTASTTLTVQLQRGARGFGFSIKGGYEFSAMPLQVFQIAKGGSADTDGRLRAGDEVLQINEHSTQNMTQKVAIELIQRAGAVLQLVVRRSSG